MFFWNQLQQLSCFRYGNIIYEWSEHVKSYFNMFRRIWAKYVKLHTLENQNMLHKVSALDGGFHLKKSSSYLLNRYQQIEIGTFRSA